MQGHNRRPSIPYRVLAEGRQRLTPRSRLRLDRDDRTPWRIEPSQNGFAAVFDDRGNPLGIVGMETAARVVALVNAAGAGR